MNARQKAKKYKKELDILKGKTVKPIIVKTRADIKTIVVEQKFSKIAMDNLPSSVIANDIIKAIASSKEFKEAVEITKIPNPMSDGTIIKGKLQVVIPDANYSDR